ncbi:MAG: epoxyqueuosine reductase [Clostridiales bacterium]|jgi:epoxyqueuosine reductase QueG|nr:epoxyqueuosine reductase [Clostridiales bacterium]
MDTLTSSVKQELHSFGALLVGFGDLAAIPASQRHGMPVGVCVAVKFPKEVIRGIANLPTKEYYCWYYRLNEKLDLIVSQGAELLKKMGYEAVAQTRDRVGSGGIMQTTLPHKTVATRAGIGWIGKCALLVTEEYGSMIRLSAILTDAPLETAVPINKSRCGDCLVCAKGCPGHAVKGAEWSLGTSRDEIFDAATCRDTARERSFEGYGIKETICGRCIALCPYTKRHLMAEG